MSTYLVALVVCDYTRIQDISKSGVILSVYTPPNMIKQAEFALGVATRLFDYFQFFFGVSYPLPKLDLVAVPDFAPGAMENWGLALFRESALLLDKNTTSSAAKQRVVLIIAHEIAHQVSIDRCPSSPLLILPIYVFTSHLSFSKKKKI